MLRIRITYTNDAEKDSLIEDLKETHIVLGGSKVHESRRGSRFKNVYIHLKEPCDEEMLHQLILRQMLRKR